MIQVAVHCSFLLTAQSPSGGKDAQEVRRRDCEIKAPTSVVRMWLVGLMFAATAPRGELAPRDETLTHSTLKPPSALVQTAKLYP